MTDERLVFCFGVGGYRDDVHENYHPASLYREVDPEEQNPYDIEEIDAKLREAFDALPKRPEAYERDDAGLGGWVRFDFEALVSGENTDPILTDEDGGEAA